MWNNGMEPYRKIQLLYLAFSRYTYFFSIHVIVSDQVSLKEKSQNSEI